MNKSKLLYAAAGVLSVGAVAASTASLASAATTTDLMVGKSDIPCSVFRKERLTAASQVLDTSTANIQTARKDHTFSQLLNTASLTKTTYQEKFKIQLTADLEAKGYNADQVTIALQTRTIHHLRNHKNK